LPPGRYVLRALVSAAAKPIKTLARSFAVTPPAVLMTPADSGAPVPVVADLFLPVDEQTLARPLVREDALKADIIGPFKNRVPASTKAAFDAGIAALSTKDYGKAQTSLKAAIQPDVDSTSALVYLGVLYALTGNEAPAAGAWQTALVDGNDMPQIYEWLAQSLIRSRSLTESRATLEEAVSKWPADPRFTGLLAQVYATSGKGIEAVRLLERYLEAKPDDLDGLRMGVEWLYQVHSSGNVVRTAADDLKLAHAWADRYGNGPQQALVRQWVDFLDRERK
jgi:tetratricopeptide (TPR) repeat protein